MAQKLNNPITNVDAMIFAAGIGKRLQPLTLTTPKALVKVQGKKLLMYALEAVYAAGIRHVVVNVHHHAEQVENFLSSVKLNGLVISVSDERHQMLETGGGVLKAQHLFKSDTVVCYNADILCDIDMVSLLAFHQKKNAKVTLATSTRDSSRKLLFDQQDKLCGWSNLPKKHYRWSRASMDIIQTLAFQGISVLQKDVLSQTKLKGIFSLIDLYLEVGKTGGVYSFRQNDYQWFDIGTIEKLKNAEGSWQPRS